jgi:hypothetical protein
MTTDSPLPAHALVMRKATPLAADLDGEVVVLDLDSGKYYDINAVGSRIWTLLERPIAVGALIDALVGEFEVKREACEMEVRAFLRELGASGLIDVSEPEVFRRRVGVEVRRLTGAGILVDTEGNHFGVNQVGLRMWDLLGEPISLDTLVETLRDEFDISTARCRQEAEAFLDELRARGLVEHSGPR